ncbi:MAG: NAD(P)-dependent oxidoreductase [TACK group archaeon]|nr:NAD(P)-dependent oxidoreductase [TACK group archaeon]
MSEKLRLGFIGLGIMGSGMAKNLLRAGFPLTVYNRTKSKAEALGNEGAVVVDTPAEVAQRSDAVFEIVTDAPDVEQVLFGKGGVVEGKHDGLIFVDESTNSPSHAKAFSERLSELGIEFLDAPVTGGDKGAREGTLTIMVGGKKEVFERVKPAFQAMGKTVVYAGEAGSGQALKLANQIVVGVDMLALVEAMVIAQRAGISMDTLYEVLSSGAGNSFTVQSYMPRIMKGDMEPGFRAAHLRKDLHYVIEMAHEFNVPLPGAALLLQLYNSLVASGKGERGTQALIQLYEDMMRKSRCHRFPHSGPCVG